MKTCNVDGCKSPIRHVSGLYCYAHYMKNWRYGTPTPEHAPSWVDIQGQRFGTLVVVERTGSSWSCKCDCGNTRVCRAGDLKRTGERSTCGNKQAHRKEKPPPVAKKCRRTDCTNMFHKKLGTQGTQQYCSLECRFLNQRKKRLRNYTPLPPKNCPCGEVLYRKGPRWSKYCSDECRFAYATHGTDNAYNKLKCRCDECKAWKKVEYSKRAHREKGFSSGKCKWEPCGKWFVTVTSGRSRMYCSEQCKNNAKQKRSGNPLVTQVKRSTLDCLMRNQQGEKFCTRCEEWLEEDAFSPNKNSPDGLVARCARCHSDSQHKLSPKRRKELLTFQLNACATCSSIFCEGKGKRYTYAVDHDHNCCPGSNSCGQCIRGLLCQACNQGIGLLREDITVLRNAIAYLQANQRGELIAYRRTA